MTQTISINLGGLLFHIDDEAYEILKSYIKAIERQFNDEREKKDIIFDIEARLSELFTERINRQKDLIRVDDVNSVILIIVQSAIKGIINPKFLIENSLSTNESFEQMFTILMNGILTEKGKIELKKQEWKQK